MPKKDEKSEVKMTADEIRHRLRKSFGPAGLDPSDPAVELEIELVAQVARVAEALEKMNAFSLAQSLARLDGLKTIARIQGANI